MNPGLFACAAAIGLCLYPAVQLLQQAHSIKRDAGVLEQTMRADKEQIDRLAALKSSPSQDIGYYYHELYEYLRVWSENYEIESLLSVLKQDADGDLAAGIRPSRWDGVGQMDIKITLNKGLTPEQRFSIFQLLGALEKRFPMSVLEISENSKGLEVEMRLYGKA